MEFDYISFFNKLITDGNSHFIYNPDAATDPLTIYINKLKEITTATYPFSPNDNGTISGKMNKNFIDFLDTKIVFENEEKPIRDFIQEVIDSKDNQKGQRLWEEIKLKWSCSAFSLKPMS